MSENNERDWSGLLPDLLHLISKKLTRLSNSNKFHHVSSDFIRFRSVCKAWRSSVPASDLPPQLPWLLEHGPYYNEPDRQDYYRVYSLFSGKIYDIHCPPFRGKAMTGSSSHICAYQCAYLQIEDENEMSLINPITNDEVCLPPINLTNSSPLWVGQNPIRSKEYVVAFGYDTKTNPRVERPMIAFCRPGDEKWAYMECLEGYCLQPCTIYKGNWICIDKITGVAVAVDIATQNLSYKIASPKENGFYNPCCFRSNHALCFVHSAAPTEILYMVHNCCNDEDSYESVFDIYMLDVENGNNGPAWVEISTIGDQMFFLGDLSGFACMATDFSGFRGNCIYFLNRTYGYYNQLYRYNIEDQSTEALDCRLNGGTWFIPTLN